MATMNEERKAWLALLHRLNLAAEDLIPEVRQPFVLGTDPDGRTVIVLGGGAELNIRFANALERIARDMPVPVKTELVGQGTLFDA